MFSLLSKNGSILSRASASPIDYVLGKSSRSSLAAHNLGARLTNPVIRSLLPISLSRKTEKGGRKRSIFYLEPKLICAKDLLFQKIGNSSKKFLKPKKVIQLQVMIILSMLYHYHINIAWHGRFSWQVGR